MVSEDQNPQNNMTIGHDDTWMSLALKREAQIAAMRGVSRILYKLWTRRCDGELDWDTADWLDKELETAGLATWRDAEEDEADSDRGIEAGEPMIVLTPTGKEVLHG